MRDQCHTDGLPRVAHLNEMRDALLPRIDDRWPVMIRGTRGAVLLHIVCILLSMFIQETSLVFEVVLKSRRPNLSKAVLREIDLSKTVRRVRVDVTYGRREFEGIGNFDVKNRRMASAAGTQFD